MRSFTSLFHLISSIGIIVLENYSNSRGMVAIYTPILYTTSSPKWGARGAYIHYYAINGKRRDGVGLKGAY